MNVNVRMSHAFWNASAPKMTTVMALSRQCTGAPPAAVFGVYAAAQTVAILKRGFELGLGGGEGVVQRDLGQLGHGHGDVLHGRGLLDVEHGQAFHDELAGHAQR